MSGWSSAAKYVSGRRRVRCSCDRDKEDSLCERRSLRAKRRGDVTPALNRWDRDRPIDPTKESTVLGLGNFEMGDGRVVEEKRVPCSNGGATLCTVEELGTTGGVKIGLGVLVLLFGFEYGMLGKIRSGGILSPKWRVSFERRLRRLRASRSSSRSSHSVGERINSELEMEVRDDRRLLDEGSMGLVLLDETCEI